MFAFVRVEFVCFLASIYSVRFGQVLRCAHKRIVNIMKVYIEKNNVQVELIRFRKNSDFIDFKKTLKWAYTFAPHVLIGIRDESPLFGCEAPGALDVSGHDHFGTECRFKRQSGSNSLLFTS